MIELLLKQQQILDKTTAECKWGDKLITNAKDKTGSKDSEEGGFCQARNNSSLPSGDATVQPPRHPVMSMW